MEIKNFLFVHQYQESFILLQHRPPAVRDRNKVGRRLTWHGDARKKKPQNEEKSTSDSSGSESASDIAENDIQKTVINTLMINSMFTLS